MDTKDIKSLQRSALNLKSNKKLIVKLKKTSPKQLDNTFHKLHKNEFDNLDCLACANCCKTTSPIFRDSDIKRISKKLRMKEIQFINTYLNMDKENDFVLKKSPCAFLDSNNSCEIYEFRPLACREYPHTNRKNMHQILDLTIRNSLICPAVSRIIEHLGAIRRIK